MTKEQFPELYDLGNDDLSMIENSLTYKVLVKSQQNDKTLLSLASTNPSFRLLSFCGGGTDNQANLSKREHRHTQNPTVKSSQLVSRHAVSSRRNTHGRVYPPPYDMERFKTGCLQETSNLSQVSNS